MTLTEFVLARITEAEARVARKAARPWPIGWTRRRVWRARLVYRSWLEWATQDEVAARSIGHRWANHPDYREEWRP